MSALAELQIYNSRPFAPTRRIALGESILPVDPTPGPGGILLGAVVATYRSELDEELFENMVKLTTQVQEGQRIVQPRLRHRFQADRHGLTRSRACLRRAGEGLALDLDNKGNGLQMMVGAVYAAGELAPTARRSVMDAIRKGMRWSGDIDRRLFAHLSGFTAAREWDAAAYDDPVQWALQTLGIEAIRNGSIHLPDRSVIQRSFRDALRTAHPDHGGATDDAATRISDLTEARRILLA
ncbi:MAG: hypothetical protein U5K30_08215 [Acidimicrobiales bacterium]|nr:hypothetical protein [Acidimicrobiales bacterium]